MKIFSAAAIAITALISPSLCQENQSGQLGYDWTVEDVISLANLKIPGSAVYALDHDNRLIVGGQSSANLQYLVRIGADNRIETSFPNTNGRVLNIAVARDGSIYVAGQFTQIGGISQSYLARLTADGKVDQSFQPVINGSVSMVTFAPDGDLFILGTFTQINATPKTVVAKLRTDGTLTDWTNSPSGNQISLIYPQSDGKLLVSGRSSGSSTLSYLLRVNADGSFDNGFYLSPANDWIEALCQLPDGETHVAGSFTQIAGDPAYLSVLLSSTGIRENTFDPNFAGTSITRERASITVLSDDSLVLSGSMKSSHGDPWTGIVGLLPDGLPLGGVTPKQITLNALPSIGDAGLCVFNGSILDVGATRSGLVKLRIGTTSSDLIHDGNIIKWQRNGPIPALRNVRFDFLPADGSVWETLANTSFQSGSWQIPDTSVGTNGILRASGERLSSPVITHAASYMNVGNATSNLTAHQTTGAPTLPGEGLAFPETYTFLTSDALRVEILNDGSGAAFDLHSTISGPDADQFEISYQPLATLPPGQQSGIEVIFKPTTPGTKYATLNLPGTGLSFPLTGNGNNVINLDFRISSVALRTDAGFDFSDKILGSIILSYEPYSRTTLTGIYAASTILPLPNLPEGSYVSAFLGETKYRFQVNYNGSQLVLHNTGRGSVDVRSEYSAYPAGAKQIVPLQGERMAIAGTFTNFSDSTNVSQTKNLAYPEAGIATNTIRSPLPNGSVDAFLAFEDGSHLIGGTFTQIGEDSAPYLARMLPNLELDTAYNPQINGSIFNMLLLPDDKVLIAGNFTTIGGQPVARLARLFPNGDLDPTFITPEITGSLSSLYRDQNGKILMGGSLTNVGGTAVNGIVRLEPDGALDPSFNVIFTGTSPFISHIYTQADGKIVIGGQFSKVNGFDTKNLARLNPSGSTDTSLSNQINSYITSLAPSSDGNIIFSYRIQPYISSLDPTGILDPNFSPKVSGTINKTIIGPDGRIHVVGYFQPLDSTSAFLAYSTFHNSPSTSVIEKNANSFTWQPGGSHPLPAYAQYQIAPTGQVGWQDFGPVFENSSDYTLPFDALPPAGIIRTISRISVTNSSYPAVSEAISFGTEAAQVLATTQNGTPLTFQATPLGLSREISLTLSSVGNIPLTDLTATISGQNSSEFIPTFTKNSLQTLPGEIAPQDSESLLIRFSPTSPGSHQASLTLSSPSLVSPLVIALSGTAIAQFSPTFPLTETAPPFAASADISPVSLSTITLTERPSPGITYHGFANRSGAPFQNPQTALRKGAFVTADFEGETFTFVTSHLGGTNGDLTFTLLNQGSVDTARHTPVDDFVYTIARLPDGKILIGGNFINVSGMPRGRIARLNPDGTLDPSFNPLLALDSRPESFHLFPDGRVLVAGSFTTVNSIPRRAMVMLDKNGNVDSSFNAQISSGAVGRIHELSDGNFLIGGTFTGLGGNSNLRHVAKIDITGTPVMGFSFAGISVTNSSQGTATIFALAELANGKLLIGGTFVKIGTTSWNDFARLNPDGSLDTSLNLIVGPSLGSNSRVSAIVEGPDGKIYLGGYFQTINTQPYESIARLDQNGDNLVPDSGFIPAFTQGVSCFSFQSDGKILVTGPFRALNGSEQIGVSRLLYDGTPDPDFHSKITVPKSSDFSAFTSLIDEDGSIFVAGQSPGANGLHTPYFVRLLNGPATTDLAMEGGNLVWQRGGTSPALKNVSFETTPDQGLTWNPVSPAPSRVTNGWAVSSSSLPASGHLRIRARNIISPRSAGYIEKLEIYGRQATPAELWRIQHFETPFNQGTAADEYDPTQDSTTNLLRRAFGIAPLSKGHSQIPAWILTDGDFSTSFVRPPFAEDIQYMAQWSETLAPNNWHEVNPTEVDGIIRFFIPDMGTGKNFIRHKIIPAE